MVYAKHQAGIGILATLIAVSVIAVTMVGFALFMGQRTQLRARGQVVNQQARELAMIHGALLSYRRDHAEDLVAAWGATPVAAPSMLTLTTQGDPTYLPANFAKRGGAIGRTPFGREYRILGTLLDVDGEKVPVWVVYVVGPRGKDGVVKRALGSESRQTRAAFKRDVVATAAQKYGVPAALLPPSPVNPRPHVRVSAPMGAWTKDLEPVFGSSFWPNARANATVLVGFPTLEGDLGDKDVTSTGDTAKWDKVRLVLAEPGVGYQPAETAVCPAGTEEIVAWPTCGAIYHRGYLIYQSDVGTITLQGVTEKSVQTLPWTFEDLGCLSDYKTDCEFKYDYYRSVSQTQDIYLEGYYIGSENGGCYAKGPSQGVRPSSYPIDAPRDNPARSSQCDTVFGTPSEHLRVEPCVVEGYYYTYPTGGFIEDKLCGVPVEPTP